MIERKKIRCLMSVLVFAVILIQLSTSNSFAKSLKSARKKFDKKNYIAAEKELKSLIKSNPDDYEARKLLKKIDAVRKQKESKKLTQNALLEIDNKNFKKALSILEKAILLDPSNDRARDLYISIKDVVKIEKKSVTDNKREKKEEAIMTGRNKYYFNGGVSFTFAESDNVDYFKTDITLLGLRLDGRYYFDYLGRRLGLSGDYTGYLIKTTGNENILFLTQRLNATVRFRTFFFENPNGKLTVGARLNFHYFNLQNFKGRGVYNFINIYGPSFGVFVSDPVIYRFFKNSFVRSIGFESEINYLFMPGKGASSPSVIDLYAGGYYKLDRFRFCLGYRLYWIGSDNVKESYNTIELSVGYAF